MNGIERIAAERKRQIEVEGWTVGHDAEHRHGELAQAGAVYALGHFSERYWPWDLQWWKPTPDNRIRELEKAGALIAAEIDRLLALMGERQ
jgi:hypothetical protein